MFYAHAHSQSYFLLLPVQFLTQIWYFHYLFPIRVHILVALTPRYMRAYKRKKCFCNATFGNSGLMEVEESRRKFTKPHEAPFLHHFAMNELLSITFCSRVLAARVGEIKLRDACRMPQGNPLITLPPANAVLVVFAANCSASQPGCDTVWNMHVRNLYRDLIAGTLTKAQLQSFCGYWIDLSVMIVGDILTLACLAFLPRCVECRRGFAMRILSVRLSVRPSHA